MISPTAHQVVVDHLEEARYELDKERVAHAQTLAALEAEQAWHADARVTVLAMMEAANAHMTGLREGIEALQADEDTHRAILFTLSEKLTAAQAEIDRLNVALQAKP